MDERGGSGIRISASRAGRRFDADHHVTTEALLFLGDLDPEAIGPSLAHATHYEPTPVGEVAALLAHVPFALARTTFIDLGSGMGRALMEAARFPFRQVVGVEISPALHAVALENFARLEPGNLACRDVRLVREDAARYRFPGGPIVVYLYNPFSGAILVRVLRRLKERAGRPVAIVYHTPVERTTIEADPAFELVAEESYGAVYGLAGIAPTDRAPRKALGTEEAPFRAMGTDGAPSRALGTEGAPSRALGIEGAPSRETNRSGPTRTRDRTGEMPVRSTGVRPPIVERRAGRNIYCHLGFAG